MSLKLGFLSDEGDTDAVIGTADGMGTVRGSGTGTVLGRVSGMGTSDSTGTVLKPVRVLYWVELPSWELKGIWT